MLKAFFGAAGLAAVLTLFATLGFQRPLELQLEKLAEASFEPLAYIVLALSGSMLVVPQRFRGWLLRFLEHHGPKVATTYAAAAGSIFGWALGAGPAFVWERGGGAFPFVLVVCSYTLLLAVTPMWIYEQSTEVATKFRRFLLSERPVWQAAALNVCGILLMGLACWGFWLWGTHG